MPLIRAAGILIYLIIILLLINGINKISRDTKTVFGSLTTNINTYFFTINNYIAIHHSNLEQFDDLIDVIYAKKKWFIHNKSHSLTEQYELFVGLKDDINYLSDYSGDELSNEALNKDTDSLFSFLFSTKPRINGLRLLLGMMTLGIGLGFIKESVAL